LPSSCTIHEYAKSGILTLDFFCDIVVFFPTACPNCTRGKAGKQRTARIDPMKIYRAYWAWLALAAVTFSFSVSAHAQKYRILYTFQGGSDGAEPYSNLLPDGSGGFYGTTWVGGKTITCVYDAGCGTIYHLSPPAQQGGAWSETQLYAFTGSSSDGAFPTGNLVKDASGNLYGATAAGGAANTGTVFELSPPAQSGGTWVETVLHAFPMARPMETIPSAVSLGGLAARFTV